ncbi:Phosphatidylinositide phosphatase SAC1 [Trichinella pseudospiralis]|uniref:Phosphatidylinositol-3-phosphatase SAC1 n=1 Tax=Trichinella pseudospiralis TaxID=6337 RepID=A0A0V0Y9P1_TRIPS|nr:Phosphatidylinositide phosphatase SAC1 [Trichinella pseudospiralis]
MSCWNFFAKLVAFYLCTMSCKFIIFNLTLLQALLQLCAASNEVVFTCGGFVRTNVSIDFKKIMVKMLTPEGNMKYQTTCAPTNGYYLIPVYVKGNYKLKLSAPEGWNFVPDHVNLNIDGLTDPCSKHEDINFLFLGFSVTGKVKVLNSPAEITDCAVSLMNSAKEVIETTQVNYGVFEFSPVLPGNYTVVVSEDGFCIKNSISFTLSDSNLALKEPVEIQGFLVTGLMEQNEIYNGGAEIVLYSELDAAASSCDVSAAKGIVLIPENYKYKYSCKILVDSTNVYRFPCVGFGNHILVMNEQFDLSLVKGDGINGVDIYVNNKFVTRTNERGMYTLSKIMHGTLTIQAKRNDLQFEDIKFSFSAQTNSIPPIIVTKIQQCGQIFLKKLPKSGEKKAQRTFICKHVNNKTVLTTGIDHSGKFCIMLPRGQYICELEIFDFEKQAGVKVMPDQLKIVVRSQPLPDVEFRQSLYKISGRIYCLFDSAECFDSVIVKLEKVGVGELSRIVVQAKFPSFEFFDMLPGKYNVKLEAEQFCWAIGEIPNDQKVIWRRENGQRLVNIDSEDVENITFYQIGFTIKLKRSYKLYAESCHIFNEDALIYNTGQIVTLHLEAVKHGVDFKLITPKADVDFTVNVKSNLFNDPFVMLLSSAVEQHPVKDGHEYRFRYFAETNEKIHIQPASNSFLFTPVSQTAIVLDCTEIAQPFLASTGEYFKGSVSPKLEGVVITVSQLTDPTVHFTLVTNTNGEYVVGPLRSLESLQIKAELPGYGLEHIQGKYGHFTAYKLSQLYIKVVDDNMDPLQDVLVSVTGGSQYKSNNLTNERGNFTLFGLMPGSYYVQSILKEYSFEPSSQVVHIEEAKKSEVLFVGRRVAFSCSGFVRFLAGHPVPEVKVEAVSENCDQHQEEALTDGRGFYRIRGLLMNCQYMIQCSKEPMNIYPEFINQTIGQMDLVDVDFTALPDEMVSTIIGRVECPSAVLPTLRAALYKKDSSEHPVSRIHLEGGSLFIFPNVPMDSTIYYVKLESSSSFAEFEPFDLPEVQIVANKTVATVVFNFHPKKKQIVEHSRGSYFVFPLLTLFTVIVYSLQEFICVFILLMWKIGHLVNNSHSVISGPYLIVVEESVCIGKIYHQKIFKATKCTVFSFASSLLHLSESEIQDNIIYVDMLQSVLNTESFYYSTTFDLTHTLQRLHNTSPEFLTMALYERADQRFVWNYHMLQDLFNVIQVERNESTKAFPYEMFAIPMMLGFVEIRDCVVAGNSFKLILISRRSCHRAGVRFHTRGIDNDGNAANFIETEQILEVEDRLSSFVQTRGSAPVFWTQKPNLRWLPCPKLLQKDHTEGFRYHISWQTHTYGNQVIISLLNKRGREKCIGDALEQVVREAGAHDVKLISIDFHQECKNMNFDRMNYLIDQLMPEIHRLGYFSIKKGDTAELKMQTGVFRTNCMDCLDRTNVVQSMIAKRSLECQFQSMKILRSGDSLFRYPAFESIYRNLWADNGDACSVQYAGTAALKSDFTRTGKRTFAGLAQDGYNALDALDLFLGSFLRNDLLGLKYAYSRTSYISVLIPSCFVFSVCMFILSAFLMKVMVEECTPNDDTVGHKALRQTTTNRTPKTSNVNKDSACGSRKRSSICNGCGHEILDQYILRVSPDLEWHAACLKCVDCRQFLDETCTCFVRDGKPYCKLDYVRLFGVRCSKCGEVFDRNDYVMRAKNNLYHISCFKCVVCTRPLLPGDEFALRHIALYCKADYELAERNSLCLSTETSNESQLEDHSADMQATLNALHHPSGQSPLSSESTSCYRNLGQDDSPVSKSGNVVLNMGLGTSGSSYSNGCGQSTPELTSTSPQVSAGSVGQQPFAQKKDKREKPKTTRVRTVLNEKQLHTLRTCYAANPRPDALMKEQLVEMTGLSPRVIRVWFQNKRCKDKKKQLIMKQIQQQHVKNQTLNGIRMQGVGPLIASSPSRHDVPMISAIEVQQYQQNAVWMKSAGRTMHDYQPAMPDDLPTTSAVGQDSQTPFQQLMHDFGDSSIPPLNYISSSAAFNATLDPDLSIISPQLVSSDLSSPSCSD